MTDITIPQNADGSYTLPDGSTATIVPTMHIVAPATGAPPSDPPPATVTYTLALSIDKDPTALKVGDTFRLTAVMQGSDGSTKPVNAYRIYGFDSTIVNKIDPVSDWQRTFTALAPGTTTIKDDYASQTAKLAITVLDADGSAPPVDQPPSDPPPPSDPSEPPHEPPPSTPITPPAPPPKQAGDGNHLLVAYVLDALQRQWYAQAYVGDDNTAAAKIVPFTDATGNKHPALRLEAYANACHVSVRQASNPYNYLACRLSITYDGAWLDLPPSSKPDGTVDFWVGCWGPAIRYGKQTPWDASKIDWSLLPSYDRSPQTAWSDAKKDYSFNGLGCATNKGMSTTGERDDIGYMSRWNMAFLTNPSDETWDVVRRADDWAGNWPVYFCTDEGKILDRINYPGATTLPVAQQTGMKGVTIVPYGGSFTGDTLTPPPDKWRTTGCPNVPNGAHLTSYALLTAMVTGDAHDRDNASFWCNWPLLEINPKYTAAGGVLLGPERRAAWCLRSIFMGGYVSSDQQFFRDETMREIAIGNTYIAANPNSHNWWVVNPVYTGDGKNDGYSGIAPWQSFYFGEALDPVAYKIPEARPLAQYVGNFVVSFFQQTFGLACTCYAMMVFNPDGSIIADIKDVVRVSMKYQYGWTEDEGQALVNAATVKDAYDAVQAYYQRAKGVAWGGTYDPATEVSDLWGAYSATDSYPAGAAAAVTAAYNCGTTGAEKALAYIQALPHKPNYSTNQKYHLVPRAA
jgi:hypothetical protein